MACNNALSRRRSANPDIRMQRCRSRDRQLATGYDLVEKVITRILHPAQTGQLAQVGHCCRHRKRTASSAGLNAVDYVRLVVPIRSFSRCQDSPLARSRQVHWRKRRLAGTARSANGTYTETITAHSGGNTTGISGAGFTGKH